MNCLHGYSEKFRICAICHHDAKQCDWGTCQKKHTLAVTEIIDERETETRFFCKTHADLVQQVSPAGPDFRRDSVSGEKMWFVRKYKVTKGGTVMVGSYSNPIRAKMLEHDVAIKAAIVKAREAWKARCEQEYEKRGDHGTCVLGAGIALYVIPPRCRNPKEKLIIRASDVSNVQGASVWEESVNDIIAMLAEEGLEAHYYAGFMD